MGRDSHTLGCLRLTPGPGLMALKTHLLPLLPWRAPQMPDFAMEALPGISLFTIPSPPGAVSSAPLCSQIYRGLPSTPKGPGSCFSAGKLLVPYPPEVSGFIFIRVSAQMSPVQRHHAIFSLSHIRSTLYPQCLEQCVAQQCLLVQERGTGKQEDGDRDREKRDSCRETEREQNQKASFLDLCLFLRPAHLSTVSGLLGERKHL